MRTAAGVILIIVAVINLFAAMFYFGLGGVGKLSEVAAEQARRDGRELAPESERSAEILKNAPGQLGTTGGKLMGFSAFLLVTVGTSIAGAVCLFRRRAAGFVIAAAVILLASELLGSLLIKFGWGNVPGLIAGIFALIGARSIVVMSRPIDPLPPPSAGAPT